MLDLTLSALLLVSAAVQEAPGGSVIEQSTQAAQPAEADDDEILVTGEKEKPDRDKKVCKRTVATGSIMPKVTCRSVRDWEAETAKSVEVIERFKAERRTRQHVQDMRDNPS